MKPKAVPDIAVDAVPRLIYQFDAMKNFGLEVAATKKLPVLPDRWPGQFDDAAH